MPIGYLITMGGVAATALSAVFRRRARTPSPFRLSYIFGLWLNWPLLTFLFLVASTALAIDQSGVHSPGLGVGLGLAIVASAGLVILRRRAQETGPAVERALDDGLGVGWREYVDAELVARLRGRPSLVRVLLAPISFRRRGVKRIANIRYGPAGRRNRLDVYLNRSHRAGRPTLIYLHARMGSKRRGARHLLYRLASQGWVCISASYRNSSTDDFSESLVDVKKVIAWAREHGDDYGTNSDAVFLAGSSLGGHLSSLAALTPNDPHLQPGFESADTSVAGVITLYGYYGSVASGPSSSTLSYATTNAPPYLVAHGDQDTLVPVDDARTFVEQRRATSSNPVVFLELPGAQHGFDLIRSRRLETVVDAIQAFGGWVTATRRNRSTPEREQIQVSGTDRPPVQS